MDERRDADDGLHPLREWRGRSLPLVELLDEVDSTNAEALRRSDRGERADGRILLARRQSAGHGSRGRAWSSPPGRSLALTAWLPWPAERPIALATWLGVVAVVDAIGALGLSATIKWPNDALVGGRKAAGVLAEIRAAPAAVALGIGLNVLQSQDELPRDAPTPPTSLRLAGAACGLLDAARTLLAALDRRIAQLAADPATIRDDFARALGLLGADVVATVAGQRWRARLVRLDLDGSLHVAPPETSGAPPDAAPLRAAACWHGGHVTSLRGAAPA